VKRSRIKPSVSDFQKEFDAMKPEVYERSQGRCEARRIAVAFTGNQESVDICYPTKHCSERATNVHHRKYRSRGGTNALDNLAHLCEPCHRFTHAWALVSNKMGLSLHAGESEELT
jgi:5-methylcytosine-specific restriction endonuclease McrA